MTRPSAIPSATYRLQLHKDFTFGDAQARVDYFQRLNISHLYLSPILTARAGSMHGYDVVDHDRVNPELGGEAELRALAARCQDAGLGLIVDIVPNHMAVGGADNALWLDVLEHGQASIHAGVFDIDFESLAGKVLVPILGEPYGQALNEGKIALIWDEALGKLCAAYGPHRLPLRPRDYQDVAGAARPALADLAAWRDPKTLHALLERQNFRLAWWRSAGDAINWRRFFDVNELAGLRVEDEAVFERVHTVIFRLYAEGVIDGVRVDHIDGLADPAAYMHRLRRRLCDLNASRPSDAPVDGPYIVVEKILGRDEALTNEWPVDGTSGYDFMNEVGALQHDPAGQATLNALWCSLSGRSSDFDVEETQARAEILLGAFAGQLDACARGFGRLAAADVATRDLTPEGFRRALVGLVTGLRLYRSYATGRPDLAPTDPLFDHVLSAARAAKPADTPSFEFIARVLRGEGPGEIGDRVTAVRRLNQLTAPVAAKAVEDTAFYRYGRLLSRTDVGFDADRLAITPAEFLATGERRAREWPWAMLTTATHDHKRGEDVRARLAVLSEIAEDWRAAVESWLADAADRPAAITPDDAYMLFQTLVGAWPIDLAADDAAGLRSFCDRVAGWRQKSLREAKLRSSWAAPDTNYEATNQAWLETLLDPERSLCFLQSLTDFVARIAPAGAINGVVQAALRCVWPGVPDLYQGAELWDLSLVDPDNRRPVDYDLRAALLKPSSLDWRSGGVKQATIASLLARRRADPALFTRGAITGLATRGARAGHVLAFERWLEDRSASVAVMLRVAKAARTFAALPSADWWADTEVCIEGEWRAASALFHEAPVFVT